MSDQAPEVAHRFSWIPYGGGDENQDHMVISVCDCGWWDLFMGPLGAGLDAARGYSEHVGYAPASDDPAPPAAPPPQATP